MLASVRTRTHRVEALCEVCRRNHGNVEAYDLTKSSCAAAQLAGYSHHTVVTDDAARAYRHLALDSVAGGVEGAQAS